jgi:hypothetical protein
MGVAVVATVGANGGAVAVDHLSGGVDVCSISHLSPSVEVIESLFIFS